MSEGEKNKDRAYENTGKQKAGPTLGDVGEVTGS